MANYNHRRGLMGAGETDFIQRGPFIVDVNARQTLVEKKKVELPPCTFNYLVTLLRHAPDAVSYQQLVADSQGDKLGKLDAQDLARLKIYMLRTVMEDVQGLKRYIMAVPGYGYRLLI